MKKICLISRKFDKECGRAEWIYAQMLKEEFEIRRFEVYTLEQKNSGVFSSKKKKAFHDFVYTPFKLIFLRLKGIQVFLFVNENQSIFSWLVRLIGGRSITVFHDFMGLKSKGIRKIYYKFVYWIASHANTIICNSFQTKGEFESMFKKKKDVHLIYPIIVKTIPLKKEIGKINKIGYLGGFDQRKRVEKIVGVAKHLSKKYVFELWGKGETKEKIEKEVKLNNLSNVHLKGYAQNNKIAEIYNSFNFFIFPTADEGLGLPIIEAMSYGNPVFVLNDAKLAPEIRKYCISCKNPKEIAEKIKELSNTIRYKKLVNESYKNSKHFSREENIKKLIKICNEK